MSPDLHPNDLFADRYRIDRLLGRGATGAVWAALDEEVGDRVALKLLTAGPDDAAERFRREVRLARQVTHRNAARIFDLGSSGGVLFLTMELVDGESLKDLLARNAPLTVGWAANIGAQIAKGLTAAHEVTVIHRDIKPANVLLDKAGRVVLTDFGLARAVASDADVTVGAVMMGTPSYMAPEQVRGESAVGPQTDIYALGAMLYEMLTGRCPFVRDTAMATAVARLQEDPADPRSLAPLPDELAELVLRCLDRAPERRPATAREVATALAAWAHESGSSDAAATLVAPSGAVHSTSATTTGRSTTASGSGSTFLSIAPEQRTLAVLPFRHRGPAELAHLTEVIAEDVVDVMASISGVRVTASGATAKYEGRAVDPREAGAELGVDAIVDGTVRSFGGSLRISVRLVDVPSGEQLWVGRLDVALAEAEERQEITAQRIAESLRQQLELLSARHGAPQEAIDLYLEARQRSAVTAMADESIEALLDLLERAIDIAPNFGLALAMHAEFAARRWFLPAGEKDETVARRAHESVTRALLRAPQLALTHYAAGRLAVSDGRFGDAARELTLALELAPTYANVHEYLGMLQCEAGRGDEGARHLELARQLDPDMPIGPSLARRCALEGDEEGYRLLVEELRAAPGTSRFMLESLELRVAGWRGDAEGVRRHDPAALVSKAHPAHRFYSVQRAALMGEGDEKQLIDGIEEVLASGSGPRLEVFMRQLAIEALIPLGALDRALEELRIVADSPAFVDTEWLEGCPSLDPLRSDPAFASLLREVRARADAIWRMRTR